MLVYWVNLNLKIVAKDLMRLAALMGYDMNVAGVGEIEPSVWAEVEKECKKTGAQVKQRKTAEEALV